MGKTIFGEREATMNGYSVSHIPMFNAIKLGTSLSRNLSQISTPGIVLVSLSFGLFKRHSMLTNGNVTRREREGKVYNVAVSKTTGS